MDDSFYDQEPERTRVESLFLRGRNILLTRADFGPLMAQWREHMAHYQLDAPVELLNLFQRALGCFALHCVSRPRRQTLSWTINFQEPLTNLFLVGDTDDDTVAGRIFTENVAQAEYNSFYQEVGKRGQEPYRSYIDFEGRDPLHAAQEYYQRSEQRPARFFQLSETQFALLAAHPDWHRDWFYRVQKSDIMQLDEQEDLHHIETRFIRWDCGCNDQRIFAALENVFRVQADELFAGDDIITVNCPRCAAKYGVTREALEGWVAQQDA
ncbi:Hsp33 family molecular chaperone HslO [Cerasicoccus frondis]|uniref:Hsp33 family molecular chaperone HslO n=1 Tax=Cerasicoccus frondis TaxID=490090 RepID=UPI002852A9D2|nr:Hsp33 family molecular chaperone HslO [Cerasicoccus frondis]